MDLRRTRLLRSASIRRSTEGENLEVADHETDSVSLNAALWTLLSATPMMITSPGEGSTSRLISIQNRLLRKQRHFDHEDDRMATDPSEEGGLGDIYPTERGERPPHDRADS